MLDTLDVMSKKQITDLVPVDPAPPRAVSRLSIKARRFAHEYAVDYNGTQAAIRAGYSARSAATIATDLLRDPRVSEIVRREARAALAAIDVDRDWVMKRAKQIALEDSSDRVPALSLLARAVGASGDEERSGSARSQHLHLHGLSDAALFAAVERLNERTE